MKKRIAVFANGWGNEYLQEVTAGAHQAAGPAGADLFVFVNFSIFSNKEININDSEANIFRLPDLKDFDGVILMANSFNTQEEADYVYRKVKQPGFLPSAWNIIMRILPRSIPTITAACTSLPGMW